MNDDAPSVLQVWQGKGFMDRVDKSRMGVRVWINTKIVPLLLTVSIFTGTGSQHAVHWIRKGRV